MEIIALYKYLLFTNGIMGRLNDLLESLCEDKFILKMFNKTFANSYLKNIYIFLN